MERLIASSLRHVADFAGHHHTCIACLCVALKQALSCGCSKRVFSTALALFVKKRDSLITAVRFGDIEVVKHLILCLNCSGHKVSEMRTPLFNTSMRATPLGHAILEGSLEMANVLLNGRANPNDMQIQRGSDVERCGIELTCSFTPLIAALPYADIMKLLIAARGSVNGPQYVVRDLLDDHPGETLTPLEFVKAKKLITVSHEPKSSSELALAILHQHRADAIWYKGESFAPGDAVIITSDKDRLLADCRSAGIAHDRDELRCAGLGKLAEVLAVDSQDNTAQLQIQAGGCAQHMPTNGKPEFEDSDSEFEDSDFRDMDGIWFPLNSLLIQARASDIV